MTSEEALANIEKNINSEKPFWKTVKAALERRVKQPPKPGCRCSYCNERLYEKHRYCPTCGQALDWEVS